MSPAGPAVALYLLMPLLSPFIAVIFHDFPARPRALRRLTMAGLLVISTVSAALAQDQTLPAAGAAPGPAVETAPPPPAAPDPLPRLLAERANLVEQYRAAQQQRNSLFGNNPSKKDLEEVVAALQGIVAKDDEIVPAVKASARAAADRLAAANAQLANVNRQLTAANAGLQNLNLDDRSTTADRLHELTDQVQNLEQKTRQQAAHQRDLLADVQEAQAARRSRDLLITLLVLACGTLGWLLYRRR